MYIIHNVINVYIPFEFSRCGGALISAHHVLTAARCVEGQSSSSVEVLLGQHSVSFKWMNSVTRLGVSSITLDPLYNISNGQNDLAILTLAQQATFSSKVELWRTLR